MVKHLNENEFENFVKENNICAVDFYADWCMPCKMLGQELEELSNEKGLAVAKIDVEEAEELAMKFQIRNIPYLQIYKNGALFKTLVGYRDKNQLESEIYG